MTEKFVQDQHFEEIVDPGVFWHNGNEGASFENCVFANCNFQKSALSGRKFYDCQFDDCDLSLSMVQETIFQNVAFRGCKLSGVLWDQCNHFALDVKFFDSKLDHSSFYALKLSKGIFQNCSLKGVDFSRAQLREAQFTGSDLQDAKFDQTVLEKADFRAASNFQIAPENNKLKGAVFALDGLPGLLTAYKLKIVP